MDVRVKRAYEPPAKSDGVRILVDHLWPRGVRKDVAEIEEWMRDLSPSTALRTWFQHDPEKWQEFKKRYFEELKGKPEKVARLAERANGGAVTLVYATKETRYNNAIALKEYLEKSTKGRPGIAAS